MSIQAINVRNQFKGKVREIIRGDVVSEVDVETPWGIVTSVITTRSVDELQLKPGSEVVALARALVHNPQLLLLDEPLGALDALTRIEMHELIENLWKAKGFTALLVTHDVQEAVALADRVILIEDGAIALDERIDLARPRSRGDASFAAIEKRILDRVLQREDVQTPVDTTWLPLPVSGLRWAV